MIPTQLRRGGQMVDPRSVAVFRIGFGLVGLVLVARFFGHGWIRELLIDPPFHFKYPGFDWVQPWPGIGMYLQFAVMGVAAAAVALGFRHRVAAVVFGIGMTHVELIDRTLYLNHYYWMILTAFLLAFLPAGAAWSVDSWRSGGAVSIPYRVVMLLRFQVGLVYFFAGLAKLNADWLFRAEPLATWLPARSEMWVVGPLLALPATAYVLAWAGALFDLTIVGWLSHPRTRLPAFVTLVGFHSVTWLLFPSIGVFPLLMSLGATVFFEPGWPGSWRATRLLVESDQRRPSMTTIALATAYVALMIILPVRHYFIPGDVRWTDEGYLGSWQVMLSEKSGAAQFVVGDDDGRMWVVPPPDYLTKRQVVVMATSPDLIRQTAALIADDLGVKVAADVMISFNGRRSVQFTDPAVVIEGRPTSDWLLRPEFLS